MNNIKRLNRKKKNKFRNKGTAEKPRLCVYRSNKHIYAQLVDDSAANTLISVNDSLIYPDKKEKGLNPVKTAFEVGRNIAEKAQGKNIKSVVFDKNGFAYHGQIKALADGARKGGLIF